MIQLRRWFLIVIAALALSSIPVRDAAAQKPTKLEIQQWRDALRLVKQELKAGYYDPAFHGMDVDARFDAADAKMESAQSLGQLVGIVAQVLLDLDDSHTYFVPPYNSTHVEYGWRIQPVGSDCYVSAVKPESDAEAKGLRVGDRVLAIDGRPMDRTKVWLAGYLYNDLRPQTSVTLLVEKPGKQQQQLTIKAQVRKDTYNASILDVIDDQREEDEDDRLTQQHFYEPSADVLIWKMPQIELTENELSEKAGKLKNRKAVILDLRGNWGGTVDTLQRFAGYFFDSNIKIADRHGRKELEPMTAKSQKEKAFKGQLIVLIDGASASAAEIFARLVQVEKRGVVIGDRSSGYVMQSRFKRLRTETIKPITFRIAVTNADVIMGDGKSLEHVGVIPDELLLPTAEEMSLNHDPVLVRAAAMVGIKLDPKKAGELFPAKSRSKVPEHR